MLDARGIELNIGDEVIFKHPYGYKKTDIFTGKIIEIGKFIKVQITEGKLVNKQPSSLFKLFTKPPTKYNHINDCWEAIRSVKTVAEIEELFKEFPRWSGEWEITKGKYYPRLSYSEETEKYYVINRFYDENLEMYDEEFEMVEVEDE